jgi:hypothetical protein
VPVARVDEWVDQVHATFGRPRIVVDPYQLEASLQRWEAQGYNVTRFTPRGGKANFELAANLRSLVVNGGLAWYPGCGAIRLPVGVHTLADEFADVTLVTTQYGFRVDNTVPGSHDDRVVALGMAALEACKRPAKKKLILGDAWF